MTARDDRTWSRQVIHTAKIMLDVFFELHQRPAVKR
jgi:hypothetical protein